jgi:hypothetical protein
MAPAHKQFISARTPNLSRVLIVILFFSTQLASAQRVGIGLNDPAKRLSVNGSILLDQYNTSNGVLDSAALLFGTQGNVGIAAKKTLGGLVNGIQIYTGGASRINVASAGQVGIGVSVPSALLHVGGDILSNADIHAVGTGRFDESLTIGGVGVLGYKLYVQNGNSYFQGNGVFTGSLTANGALTANSASVTNSLSIGSNLNVANDGIVDGNFRVNGRIGINGATNLNYGLIVNNANTYLQGNTSISGNATISGNTTIQGSTSLGEVTIQGKGSVRSNGTSALRIGFSSVYVNQVMFGHEERVANVSLPEFSGSIDNIRVSISQFEPGSYSEQSYFKWYVYDVNATDNTCKIRLINDSGIERALRGTFYLLAVAKD